MRFYQAHCFRLVVHRRRLLRAFERVTLSTSLVVAVAELRRSVDKLESDLLDVFTRGVDLLRLTDRQHTLLNTRAATLDHQEVVLHNTVVRETTHWRDRLLSRVKLCRTGRLVSTVADTVNLLV